MALFPFATLPTDLIAGGPNVLTRDLAALGIIPPLWGIFSRGGKSVVVADNVFSIDYRNEFSISDYPQERGAFQSYNKVNNPRGIMLEFVSGGSFSNRQALLNSIDAIAGDLKIYDVVTPEKTYTKMNVEAVLYTRKGGQGAGMIKVGVRLIEIRDTAVSELSTTTEKPSGTQTQNGGQVQTAPPTTTQSSILHDAFNAPTGTVVTGAGGASP